MAIPKKSSILSAVQERIRKNLKFATLSFLFIIAYVNVFQKVFGAENSIVGVIFAIMMSASMVRDLTSTPFKHLLAQSTVLVLMAAAACLVVTLNPWIALPINFIMIFLILYLYTYEYSGHLYFPYDSVPPVPDFHIPLQPGTASKADYSHGDGSRLHHSLSAGHGTEPGRRDGFRRTSNTDR